MKQPLAVILMILSFGILGAGAQAGKLSKYSELEVVMENTRNERGQKLPDELIAPLKENVIHAIGYLHLFSRIGDITDESVAAPAAHRALVLKVKITGYSGAQNNASVSSQLSFTDQATGQPVFQESVRAKLYYDSGSTQASLAKLAKSIAGKVRDNW